MTSSCIPFTTLKRQGKQYQAKISLSCAQIYILQLLAVLSESAAEDNASYLNVYYYVKYSIWGMSLDRKS